MHSKFAKILCALPLLALIAVPALRAQKNKGEMTPMLSTGPVRFYVTIQSQKQGVIKGQSTTQAHQGQIEGSQFSFSVTSPRNMSSGMAMGHAQYSAVTFTKQWDASSPQIMQAATTNEVLPSVQFDFVRPGPNGQEYTFETIRLTDASISSIKHYIEPPSTTGGGPAMGSQALEEVSFTFRNISISNTDGKTSMSDNWMQ